MKSRKLNADIRARICQQLLKPQADAILNKKKRLGESIFQFIERLTPVDIVKFSNKYPQLVTKWKMFFVEEIKSYVPVEFYITDSFNLDDLNRLISLSDNCKELIADIQLLTKEQKVLQNKCLCALEQINTTNQLKGQFPEAYEAYCRYVEKSEGPSENACDSIEDIRAELDKLNKR